MKKLSGVFIVVVIMLTACREKEQAPIAENPEQEVQEQDIDTLNPPRIISLKPAYEAEIKQWEAFNNLEIEMQKLQKTTQNENFLIIEDLLNLEKQLAESDFPEKFDIPAIKSRILVFKTYLLQTKAMANREEPDNRALKEQHIKIIAAFNAVKKQLAQTFADDITEKLLKDLEQLNDTIP